MSRLNVATLQAALVSILGVPAAYVVPKQGTWWNPQATENYPGKPKTWCAFRIEGTRTIDAPHYVADPAWPTVKRNWSVVHKSARISLQFVGDAAEDLANSVAHWLHRMDVQQAFGAFDGRLMADMGEVVVTDFAQEGENTVLAYNVTIRIVYADEIDSQQSSPAPDYDFSGTLVIPS